MQKTRKKIQENAIVSFEHGKYLPDQLKRQ